MQHSLRMFINSFGHLSQALVQSYGRPDITAKLHVAELVVYVPYLSWLIDGWGPQASFGLTLVAGAAMWLWGVQAGRQAGQHGLAQAR